jgi:hypothetical protein
MMTIQNLSKRILLATIAVIVLISASTTAFAPPASSFISQRSTSLSTTITTTKTTTIASSTTRLSERKWNFNEGQSPWGMKQNAETWNGRIAQVCCEKEKRDLIAASIQLNSKRLI